MIWRVSRPLACGCTVTYERDVDTRDPNLADVSIMTPMLDFAILGRAHWQTAIVRTSPPMPWELPPPDPHVYTDDELEHFAWGLSWYPEFYDAWRAMQSEHNELARLLESVR